MPLLPAAAQAVPLLAVNQYVDADGTAAFDADDTPGHDSSANNGRVRTQDTVRLRWEWSLNDAADTGVTLTSTLPAGSGLAWVADRLPNTCGPGSGVSPDGLTLTCVLGDRIEGSNGVVRPFVQVGSVLLDGDTFDVDVTVSSDGAAPVTTPADTITVTSAPNVDLVKADEDNGVSLFQDRSVNPNTGQLGVVMLWPVTLEVGGTGRGAENVAGPVTWEDDVTGLGPNAVLADWPIGNLGVTVANACGPNAFTNIQIPWGAVGINPNATAPKSVTDSGTWACAQPGGPGTPIQVSVTGADLTGAHTPTLLGAGPNTQPIAPDRKILLSGWIPTFTAYTDMLTMPGIFPCPGSDPVTGEPFGAYGGVTFTNTVTNLVADGVSGNPNVGDDPANNTNDAPVFVTCPGGWSSYYESSFNEMRLDGGLVGYLPGEVHDYRDVRPPTLGGENSRYPITQTQTEYAGDGTAAGGDRFTFQMTRHNTAGASVPEMSMCAKFDPATIRVIDQPGYENRVLDPSTGLETSHTNIPGTPGSAVVARTYNQYNDEDGFPLGAEFDTPPAQAIVEGVDYVVEYGTGGYANTADRSATVQCADADSPTGWQTDTGAVPGGPDAITKVRVRMLRPLADDEQIRAWVSFEVRSGLAPGTRIATSSSFNDDWQNPASPWTYDQAGPGTGPGYDETVHAFNGYLYGDRLTAASNRLAITKSVDPPLTTPVVNGDTLNYSVEAFVDGNGTANGVQVIDIVPAGVTYVGPTGATPAPDIVIPGGGGPGTTLLIWLVNGGGPVPGPASFPFTYEARVNNDAGDYSSLLNVALIQAAGINQPSGTVAVAFSNTGGTAGDFEIFKQVVTPLIAPGGQITYVAAYQNTGSTTYDGADFVDVLPYNGDGANTTDRDPASGFTGDADLVSVTGGLGETIFYTDAPSASVSLDPDVALPGGYLWCELADFGTAGCPAAIGDVTAFRVENPNPINPGDPPGLITVTMQSDPATVAGDLYTNNFGGRVRPTDANTLPVISNDVTATVITPGVSIDKLVEDPANPGTFVESAEYNEGQPVTWQITVTNTDANAPLTGVTVTDPNAAECDNTIGDLAGGDSVTYTCTAAGGYSSDTTNTATVDAVDPFANTLTDSDDAEVTIAPPAIQIDKLVEDPANPGTFVESAAYPAGAPVTWQITVTNTGGTTLTDVTVTDPNAAACTSNVGDLAGGDSVTYTCTVAAGYPAATTNTATATGTPPAGPDVTDDDDASITTTNPAITIDKTVEDPASPGTFDETATYLAGQPVTWEIVVTNTGDVALTDVEVSDPNAPACDNTIGNLAAGASVTYTCTVPAGYTADTTNTATVTGTEAGGTAVVTDDDPSQVVIVTPAIDIRKLVETQNGSGTFIEADASDNLAGQYISGQNVTFRVQVTNTGDVDLTDVTVTDPNALTCNNVIGNLAAGATVTYTCTVGGGYPADTINVADVTGDPVGVVSPNVTDTDPAAVNLVAPAITIDKTVETAQGSGSFDETGTYLAGQPVTWQIVVTNTGDVDLTGVTVTDPNAAACVNNIGALAAGASVTYTCTVPAGYNADTTNTASVVGVPPVGPNVTDTDPADVVIVDPGIEIQKTVETREGSGDFDETGTYTAGQPVTFTIMVTNTGNVDLDNVEVTDPLAAACDAVIGALAAGDSDTYTCTVPAGYPVDTTNVAAVTGDPVGVTSPDVTDDDPADVVVVAPAIDIQTQVETQNGSGTFIEADGTDGLTGAYLSGQPVTWRIVVTNTGDTDLTDVTVTAPNGAACNNVIGNLAAGASVTYTCVVAGGYPADATLDADVVGTPVGVTAPDVTDEDPASIEIVDPAITIDKTVETTNGSGTFDENGTYTAGQPVTFTIVVTNTGTTDLGSVAVTDPLAAECDNTIGFLAAGASTTYLCTVAAGYPADTTNVADVVGTPAGVTSGPVTDSDPADVDIVDPAVAIAKSVETRLGSGTFDEAGTYRAGQPVTFTIVVTNTGTTDLDNVEVTDPAAPGCDNTIGFLAAGDSVTYTCAAPAGYTSDTTNLASVTGDPVGVTSAPVTDDDPAQVDITNPAIDIQKQVETENGSGTFIEADGTDGLAGTYLTGQPVTFRVTVTNPGDSTLTDVTVTDPNAPTCNNVIGTLPAGATVTYTCTHAFGYTGDTTNTADVTGTPPAGPDVTDTDPADVNVINPALSVTKEVETTQGSGTFAETGTYTAGQPVTWRVTVANTGDVDLSAPTVTDPLAAACDLSGPAIPAGASFTYTCTAPAGYPADMTNTVTFTANDPLGNELTDTDTADVDIVDPAIAITKTVETREGSGDFDETGTYLADQPVAFEITVTNTGDTDLDNVTVSDPAAADCDTTIGLLPAGDSVTITCAQPAGYTGDTTNTATVTGDPVGVTSFDVTADDDAQVDVVAPAVEIRKQVEATAGSGTFIEADLTDGLSGLYLIDSPVTFRVTVANNGGTPLSGVTVTDPLAANCNNAVGSLAVGASVTYTCAVPAGYSTDTTNVASVTGNPVGVTSPNVTDSDPADVNVTDPAIQVDKTVETQQGSGDFDETGTYLAGDAVTFTIVVTNTGDTDLSGVAVTDPVSPACDRTIGALPAGDDFTYTCTVAAGFLTDTTNTAEAAGTDSLGTDVTDTDPADVDIVDPAVAIDKTVETEEGSGVFADAGRYRVGQPVTFTIVVTNTGTTDLDNVTVTDPLASGCDATIGFLAAGDSDTYSCTVPAGYAGDTTNAASVTGDPIGVTSGPVTDSDTAAVDIANPAIGIRKQVETEAGSGTFIEADLTDGLAGLYLTDEPVTFRVTVTNPGDTDLTDVTVTDPAAATCNNVIGTLPAGETVTYTCTVPAGYTADTTNTATVTGTPDTGSDVTAADTADVNVIDPAIAIAKTVETVQGSGSFAETGTYTDGQAVTFTITVANTGDTDLTDVTVTDPNAPDCDTVIGSLAAGASTTFTCDQPAGYGADTTNTASVTGTDPLGNDYTDDDPADVVIAAPDIDIQKVVETTNGSGTFAETGTYTAGQPVTFQLTVTNTGTTDLDNVTVTDPQAAACDTTVGFLAAGDSTVVTCTVPAGYSADTTNTAEVTGDPVGVTSGPVTDSDPADVDIAAPAIEIAKTVETVQGSGTFAELGTYTSGQAVTWRIVVTNTGDTDLENVTVTDPAAGTCANSIGDLAVGASVTYTCTVAVGYSVDTTNVADVSGDPVGVASGPVTDSDPADVDIIDPAIEIAKTVETTNGSGTFDETGTYTAGQAVTFTIVVTNTGDTDLGDVTVTDPNGAECDNTIGFLAAGASTTYLCTVTGGYPADTTNVASVTGTPPAGPDVTDDDDAQVDIVAPAVTIDKTVETDLGSGDFDETGEYRLGQDVTFTITVTNTGDTDLGDVTVTDPAAAACDNTIGDLPAGATVTYTCTVTGGYTSDTVNRADVTGDPAGVTSPNVTDDDTAAVVILDSVLDIQKQVEDTQGSGTFIEADGTDGLAGLYLTNQAVTFRVTVTNTGNAALADVTVTDPLALGCNNVIGTLAAGATVTYTCTVPAGYSDDTTNVADVVGQPVTSSGRPVGDELTDSDPADVDVIDPAIAIDKTVETLAGSGDFDETGTYRAGQAVTWQITVTNTGDADLVDVTVTDPAAAACDNTIGDLPAGASVTYTCTVSGGYTADTVNTATAAGGDPLGNELTDDDTAAVDIVNPAVEIQKAVETGAGTGDFAETGYYAAGDDVTFTITVTNTGDADLDNVVVTDPNAPGCDTAVGFLAAGDSTTFTCTAPAGDYTNTADVAGDPVDANGDPLGGPPVTDTDTADVVALDAGLEISKQVETANGTGTFIEADSTDSRTGLYLTNQAVTWRITVTNTGDADLVDVTVTDPAAPLCDTVVGALAAGATVTYDCTVPAGYSDDVTNTASVTGQPVSPLGDPVGDELTDDDTAAVDVIDPAIRIDKAVETGAGTGDFDENGTYRAGQPVTWQITVTNTGDTDLVDVTVTDPAAAACDNDTIGDLPAGATVTYTCTAADGYPADTVNTAQVTGVDPLGNELTDSDTAAVDVIDPAIRIDKTVETVAGTGDFDENGTYRAGQPVTWQITVTNTGDADLVDVTVTDPNAAACGDTIGDLPAGASVTYTCTAADGYTADTVNTAQVTGQPVVDGDPVGDPVTDDDTAAVTIRRPVDVSVDKGLVTALRAGQDADWRIVVTNNGPVTALAPITVTDTLPADLAFVQVRSGDAACSASGQTVTCVLDGDLPVGAHADIVITTRVDSDMRPGQQIVNRASVTLGSQDDTDATNDRDTAVGQVTAPPVPPGPTPPPPGGSPSVPTRFLAYTGDHIAQIALLAGLVLVSGLVLIAVRRRRRDENE